MNFLLRLEFTFFSMCMAFSSLSFGNKVPIEGYAYSFYSNDPIPSAEIAICHSFSHSCVETKTDEDGRFLIGDFLIDDEIFVQLEKPGFQTVQTANFKIPPAGLVGDDKIVLQVPGSFIYGVFSTAIWADEHPQYCHVAGTVLAEGKTHNDLPHGREGVTVFAENIDDNRKINADFYFGIFDWTPFLFTNKTNPFSWFRSSTSADGGFLFFNLLPGRYQIWAQRDGDSFSNSQIECRPGAFINLNPPHGPVQFQSHRSSQ